MRDEFLFAKGRENIFPQRLGLTFADGQGFSFLADSPETEPYLQSLRNLMQLSMGDKADIPIHLIESKKTNYRSCFPALTDGRLAFPVPSGETGDMLTYVLQRLANLMVMLPRPGDRFLLHGALLEYHGRGVILAGDGGAGKTTACARLPHPWRALSDDAALVVCDEQGRFRAHPWPTWSRLYFNGPGGSWPVALSVPVDAVLFIEKSDSDCVSRLSRLQSFDGLVRAARQMNWADFYDTIPADFMRQHHSRLYERLTELARLVPGYELKMSRAGAFWSCIEPIVAENIIPRQGSEVPGVRPSHGSEE
ncbi:SynChlorMet cassette protein ScmC [candidate division KSB1 bacterium]|nr:SynChlorMet cassette protein ScmC [candidate division KSB1 bacterium]